MSDEPENTAKSPSGNENAINLKVTYQQLVEFKKHWLNRHDPQYGPSKIKSVKNPEYEIKGLDKLKPEDIPPSLGETLMKMMEKRFGTLGKRAFNTAFDSSISVMAQIAIRNILNSIFPWIPGVMGAEDELKGKKPIDYHELYGEKDPIPGSETLIAKTDKESKYYLEEKIDKIEKLLMTKFDDKTTDKTSIDKELKLKFDEMAEIHKKILDEKVKIKPTDTLVKAPGPFDFIGPKNFIGPRIKPAESKTDPIKVLKELGDLHAKVTGAPTVTMPTTTVTMPTSTVTMPAVEVPTAATSTTATSSSTAEPESTTLPPPPEAEKSYFDSISDWFTGDKTSTVAMPTEATPLTTPSTTSTATTTIPEVTKIVPSKTDVKEEKLIGSLPKKEETDLLRNYAKDKGVTPKIVYAFKDGFLLSDGTFLNRNGTTGYGIIGTAVPGKPIVASYDREIPAEPMKVPFVEPETTTVKIGEGVHEVVIDPMSSVSTTIAPPPAPTPTPLESEFIELTEEHPTKDKELISAVLAIAKEIGVEDPIKITSAILDGKIPPPTESDLMETDLAPPTEEIDKVTKLSYLYNLLSEASNIAGKPIIMGGVASYLGYNFYRSNLARQLLAARPTLPAFINTNNAITAGRIILSSYIGASIGEETAKYDDAVYNVLVGSTNYFTEKIVPIFNYLSEVTTDNTNSSLLNQISLLNASNLAGDKILSDKQMENLVSRVLWFNNTGTDVNKIDNMLRNKALLINEKIDLEKFKKMYDDIDEIKKHYTDNKNEKMTNYLNVKNSIETDLESIMSKENISTEDKNKLLQLVSAVKQADEDVLTYHKTLNYERRNDISPNDQYNSDFRDLQPYIEDIILYGAESVIKYGWSMKNGFENYVNGFSTDGLKNIFIAKTISNVLNSKLMTKVIPGVTSPIDDEKLISKTIEEMTSSIGLSVNEIINKLFSLKINHSTSEVNGWISKGTHDRILQEKKEQYNDILPIWTDPAVEEEDDIPEPTTDSEIMPEIENPAVEPEIEKPAVEAATDFEIEPEIEKLAVKEVGDISEANSFVENINLPQLYDQYLKDSYSTKFKQYSEVSHLVIGLPFSSIPRELRYKIEELNRYYNEPVDQHPVTTLNEVKTTLEELKSVSSLVKSSAFLTQFNNNLIRHVTNGKLSDITITSSGELRIFNPSAENKKKISTLIGESIRGTSITESLAKETDKKSYLPKINGITYTNGHGGFHDQIYNYLPLVTSTIETPNYGPVTTNPKHDTFSEIGTILSKLPEPAINETSVEEDLSKYQIDGSSSKNFLRRIKLPPKTYSQSKLGDKPEDLSKYQIEGSSQKNFLRRVEPPPKQSTLKDIKQRLDGLRTYYAYDFEGDPRRKSQDASEFKHYSYELKRLEYLSKKYNIEPDEALLRFEHDLLNRKIEALTPSSEVKLATKDGSSMTVPLNDLLAQMEKSEKILLLEMAKERAKSTGLNVRKLMEEEEKKRPVNLRSKDIAMRKPEKKGSGLPKCSSCENNDIYNNYYSNNKNDELLCHGCHQHGRKTASGLNKRTHGIKFQKIEESPRAEDKQIVDQIDKIKLLTHQKQTEKPAHWKLFHESSKPYFNDYNFVHDYGQGFSTYHDKNEENHQNEMTYLLGMNELLPHNYMSADLKANLNKLTINHMNNSNQPRAVGGYIAHSDFKSFDSLKDKLNRDPHSLAKYII